MLRDARRGGVRGRKDGWIGCGSTPLAARATLPLEGEGERKFFVANFIMCISLQSTDRIKVTPLTAGRPVHADEVDRTAGLAVIEDRDDEPAGSPRAGIEVGAPLEQLWTI